jgi:hypothetical protein
MTVWCVHSPARLLPVILSHKKELRHAESEWHITGHSTSPPPLAPPQVIVSNLINFIMLGLVFARFSAPFKRANSIQFSSLCTVSRHAASGCWAITFRWGTTCACA